jgi:hypothetical protein
MILDDQLKFSDAQAITAAAASTNCIDLGAVRDIGSGEPLYIAINVDVAFTDGSSDSTLAVAIEGDSTTTFTPDGTHTLLVIPASAAAGSVYYIALPPGSAALAYRYIRLKYTPAGGDLTTGSISAYLVKGVQRSPFYADAITVS